MVCHQSKGRDVKTSLVLACSSSRSECLCRSHRPSLVERSRSKGSRTHTELQVQVAQSKAHSDPIGSKGSTEPRSILGSWASWSYSTVNMSGIVFVLFASSQLCGRVAVWASAPHLRKPAEFLINALMTLRKVSFLLRNLCRIPQFCSLAGTVEEITCGLDLKMIQYRPSGSSPSYTSNSNAYKFINYEKLNTWWTITAL